MSRTACSTSNIISRSPFILLWKRHKKLSRLEGEQTLSSSGERGRRFGRPKNDSRLSRIMASLLSLVLENELSEPATMTYSDRDSLISWTVIGTHLQTPKLRRSCMPFRRTSRDVNVAHQNFHLSNKQIRSTEDLGCRSDMVLATTAVKWSERGLPKEPLGSRPGSTTISMIGRHSKWSVIIGSGD